MIRLYLENANYNYSLNNMNKGFNYASNYIKKIKIKMYIN